MKYADWLESVPKEIKNDSIWNLEVYRLALFAGDIGKKDVLLISKNQLMFNLADQLQRSLNSISANITEGYSRSKGLERARFLEYSLGSARESRDWYYKAKDLLSEQVIKHRLSLLTQIIAMLTSLIFKQRVKAIREAQADYNVFDLDTSIPFN